MGYFWAKYVLFELKKYSGIIFHETEERYKIWRGIDLFQNWHKEFDKIWPKHSKVSKIFILMGSFWAKYVLLELKKYRGVIFHYNEEWCKIWRKNDLLLENADFHQSTWKYLNWNFDKIFVSKVENMWASSWQWRLIQKLKRKWLVILKLIWTSQNFTRALEKTKTFLF